MKDKTKIILSIIITFIVTLTITVTASFVTDARNITFTSDKTDKTNVSDSLDELYTLTKDISNPWEGINGEVYYLGTSTNYDIPSLITSGKLPTILDYTKLTSDNFITIIDTIPNLSAQKSSGSSYQYVSGKTISTPVNKNYNSQTGVLNISGGTYQLHVCIANGYSYCSDAVSTATATVKTYLVIGPIK